MSDALWLALGLLLVFEGLLPFVSPQRFREALARLATLDDRLLRGIGLGSMICGLLVLNAVK